MARRPRRRAVKDTEPQVEPQPSEFNDPLLATSTPTKSTEVSDVPATVEIASISDPGV